MQCTLLSYYLKYTVLIMGSHGSITAYINISPRRTMVSPATTL